VARSALLVAGGGVGLAGMVGEREWMVWIALVLLVLAFGLRFSGRSRPGASTDSDWDDDEIEGERQD